VISIALGRSGPAVPAARGITDRSKVGLIPIALNLIERQKSFVEETFRDFQNRESFVYAGLLLARPTHVPY